MYSDNLTNEFYKKRACACGISPPAEVSLIPIKIGISRVPFFFFFFQGVSLFVTPFSPLLLPLTSFLFLPSNYRLSITSVVEPATSHSPVDFLVFVTLQLGESQVGVIKLLYATGGETDLSTLRFKSSARADRQQRIISGADVYSAFSSLRQKKSEADQGLGVTFVFWCFIEKKKKKRYLYSTYQNIVSEIRDTDYTHKTLWYPHVRKKKNKNTKIPSWVTEQYTCNHIVHRRTEDVCGARAQNKKVGHQRAEGRDTFTVNWKGTLKGASPLFSTWRAP